MKRVYKFELEVVDEQILILPLDSTILSVKEQRQRIVLFALVDVDEKEIEKYKIIIHGTGHDADDVWGYNFLGTVKLHDGHLMFHVFYNKVKKRVELEEDGVGRCRICGEIDCDRG